MTAGSAQRSGAGSARERRARPRIRLYPREREASSGDGGQFSRWGPLTGIARERETSADDAAPYSNREDQLWQIDRLILERLGEA